MNDLAVGLSGKWHWLHQPNECMSITASTEMGDSIPPQYITSH